MRLPFLSWISDLGSQCLDWLAKLQPRDDSRRRGRRLARLAFESLEMRQMFAAYTWSGAASGGSWVGTNAWKITGSTPAIYGTPAGGDTVTISGLNAGASITLDGGRQIGGLTIASNNSQTNVIAQGTGSGGLRVGTGGITTSGNQSKGISADIYLDGNQAWSISNTNGLTVSGAIHDYSTGPTLTKTGAQVLALSGNNDFTGVITVSAGTLRAGHTNALGTTAGNTVVSSSGTLSFGATSIPEDVNVAGALTTSSASSLLGELNLNVSSSATVPINTQSGALTLAGKVTGTGGITKQGLNNLVLSNSTNDYGGDTIVNSTNSSNGILLGADNVIPNGSSKGNVLVNTGFFDLNGHNETINGLSSTSAVTTGIVTNSATGTWTLTVGDNDTNSSFAGKLTNSSNKPLALTKIGYGTFIVSNTNNDYQGNTTIDGGTFKLGASQVIPHGTGKGNVVVNSGGTLDLNGLNETINGLSGTGTVGNTGSTATVTINSGSTVAPGTTSTTGILNTVNIAYASSSTSVFDVDINGGSVGNEYDQLNVTGTVDLGTSTILNVSVSSAASGAPYFIIINNDGSDAVTGTFAGKPEGTEFTSGGQTFRITYKGNDGNDVVLVNTLPSTVPCFDCIDSLIGSNLSSGGAGLTSGGASLQGQVAISKGGIASGGFGSAFGQSNTWTNQSALAGGSSGSGMAVSQAPRILQVGSDTLVIVSGPNTYWFDKVGGDYVERYFGKDTLTHDTVGDQFVLKDPTGRTVTFNDFDVSHPATERGLFEALTDNAGNTTSVISRTPDGQVEEVQRSAVQNGDTITESYLYTYIASGDNAGLQESVELRRKVNSGDWSVVRREEYAYYDGVEDYGSVGDLKTSVIKDSDDNLLDTTYYRYYVANEADGYQHGLKYIFGSQSFARLSEAFVDPFGATDIEVAPYADGFLEYDSQHRVVTLVNQGEGCSACTGGLGTYNYEYSTSQNADGYNSWKFKTVETLPDGNQNITYSNFAGQAILSIFKDTTTDQEWLTFSKYDSAGRLILEANPSAVTGYNEAYADLLHDVSGNYQYLADDAGLITVTSYYATTTATSSTAGGAQGYFEESSLRHGELGDDVPQNAVDYFERTVGDTTIFVLAKSTVYRNDDGTGGQTTSYDYTWFADTTQLESTTVTLPVISAAQNGPNVADESTTVNDTYGRVIWTKDADGFLTYFEYDQATGAVTMMIQDVETDPPAYYPTLPSGWATPAGGGLNLITSYAVDSLGRTTKMTDPNGHVTFTVYNDPNYEVRTYSGFTWDPLANGGLGAYVQMSDPPPTTVSREDRPGSYTETLTMAATPTVDSNGVPTGAESIGSIQTLSRQYKNDAGQMITGDQYFDFTGLTYSTDPDIGVEGTNFYRTEYSYDNRGRQHRTVSAVGTITRTVFDGLSRAVSTWVGTDDTPTSGFWSPTNNAGANMVKVSENQYDNGEVGDSNLTRGTAFPDDSGTQDRVTDYFHDWRDRTVATKSGVLLDGSGDPDPTGETDGLHRPITYTVYDNLGEATESLLFDGDGVTITATDGVPDQPSASLLRAKIVSNYDDQGRVFQSSMYSVDQTDGTVSTDALTGETFFNHRGMVVKASSPGGLVQKSQYDGAGRPVKSFVTDGGGDTGWADALNVTDDNVLEQYETVYDAASNEILSISKARFHDETGTGELGDASSGVLARVSYAAMYYDEVDRQTDLVNVGTNGGSSYTRPGSVPSRSDTVLVTSYGYDESGWQSSVVDPRSIESRTEHDRLGRTTQTIQAYVDGAPSAADDLTTQYTYDGLGHVLTLTALLPGSTHQTTEYVYGVTTSGGSDINSNDLLATVKYPDKTTGNPSTSAADQESFAYNSLGQTKQKSDRNDSEHDYLFDQLGRSRADVVSTLGSGVDGAARRIGMNYDTAGRVFQITSYGDSAGTTVVNQVERHYNGLSQLTAEYQEHSGAVNTTTSPVVQYAYSEMTGGANHSRATSMTYPDGRIVRYEYATGLDDYISRLSFLADDNSGSVGTHLEEFDYLGLGTVVARKHPESGVDLTYIKQGSEPDGDAGDQYTGLDRFGRIVDQRWIDSSTTAVDRFGYGYDRDSNRLYRENLVDAAFGELYHDGAGYDLLNRLTSFARGTLNGSKDAIASPSRSQEWDLDALGNWDSLTNDGGTPEDRDHNAQNQVTDVGANALAFDNNGNTTTDEQGRILIYDAWNRLVEVQDSGSTPIAEYAYDGLNRRNLEDSGTARALYYSSNWQVVEERESGIVVVQNVWSPVYIDALILRDRDADNDINHTLEDRLYALHDANFNVTALANTSGAVIERYIYDPYGTVTILDDNFSPDGNNSSDVDWRYLHQGTRLDTITSNYQMRYREYSATLGRWLQRDPIEYASGEFNLYAFCNSGPVNNTDPQGLKKTRTTTTFGYKGPKITVTLARDPVVAAWAAAIERDINADIAKMGGTNVVGVATPCPAGHLQFGERVTNSVTNTSVVPVVFTLWSLERRNPNTGRLEQGPFVGPRPPAGWNVRGSTSITLPLTKTEVIETIECRCWKIPKLPDIRKLIPRP
ncbi:MAG: autotransporter-associated beta strand repeat-containing protein [Planctomycetes bacterium]|nr:autotransporter-associated beta strand repeat-containing protein [Planctomycetota bacterium]